MGTQRRVLTDRQDLGDGIVLFPDVLTHWPTEAISEALNLIEQDPTVRRVVLQFKHYRVDAVVDERTVSNKLNRALERANKHDFRSSVGPTYKWEWFKNFVCWLLELLAVLGKQFFPDAAVPVDSPEQHQHG